MPKAMRQNLRKAFIYFHSIFTVFQLVSSVRPLMFAWFPWSPQWAVFSVLIFSQLQSRNTQKNNKEKNIIEKNSLELENKKNKKNQLQKKGSWKIKVKLQIPDWQQTNLGLLCKYRLFTLLSAVGWDVYGPPHPRPRGLQCEKRNKQKEKAHLLIFNRLLNLYLSSSSFSSLPSVDFSFCKVLLLGLIATCVCMFYCNSCLHRAYEAIIVENH